MHGYEQLPDHSLLSFDFNIETIGSSHNYVNNTFDNDTPKYNLAKIPVTFLNDESALDEIVHTIDAIEHAIKQEANLNSAYDAFANLIKSEMQSKLTQINNTSNKANTRHKCKSKPYWTSNLQKYWEDLCILEKH